MTPLERELQALSSGARLAGDAGRLAACRRPHRRSERPQTGRAHGGSHSRSPSSSRRSSPCSPCRPRGRRSSTGSGSAARRSSGSTTCRRVSPTPGLEILGDRVTLDEARARAGFPFADPPDDERDARSDPPGDRDARHVRLARRRPRRDSSSPSSPASATEPGLVKKLVSSATRIEHARDRRPPSAVARGRAARRALPHAGRQHSETTSAGSRATRCSSRTTA